MQPPEHPWRGKTPDELVPTVDPADLKARWQLCREVEARHPGKQVAIAGGFEGRCSPGADIRNVGYRAAMLNLLFHSVEQNPQEPEARALAKFQHGDELDDRLFKVMAQIPLRWIPEGGMRGYPFDVEAFIKQVEQEAA